MRLSFNRDVVRKLLTRTMSVGLIVGVAACDTDVVNPGPIEADFLNDPDAQAAIQAGAGRAAADALNWIAYTSAAVAREIHPSGSTGSFGITPLQQGGTLRFDEVGTQWENAHRARFLVADGAERILSLDAGERDDENLAQLYLWGAFNARLMGEQFCQAVIPNADGTPGSASDSDDYLAEALAWFDQAEQLGSEDIATAARAGRASVNAFLGNWGAAMTDAATIPEGFSYAMPYFDLGDDTQANRIFIAGKAVPYKAHSQLFTWIEQYNPADAGGGDTDVTVADEDPRVSWRISGENGDAATSCCGVIAWYPQTKYANDDSAIELASYEEMQLLIAENEIVNNNDPDAGMAIVNALRTAAGVPTVSPAGASFTQDEALEYFLREHAIEMWLEGRRLPAMRRWDAAGVDLEALLQPLERVGDGDTNTGSHLSTRDFCFPISEGERNANPNIT